MEFLFVVRGDAPSRSIFLSRKPDFQVAIATCELVLRKQNQKEGHRHGVTDLLTS